MLIGVMHNLIIAALDIDDIEFVLVQDCIHSREFYREAHFVLLNYRCKARGEINVTLNEEAQEYCWASIEDAWNMELNNPTRVLLDAINRGKESRG